METEQTVVRSCFSPFLEWFPAWRNDYSQGMPTITDNLNFIKWKMSEIKRPGRRTRKLLTIRTIQHPKADVNRMCLPRRVAERALTKLETAYKLTTIGLETYFRNNDNALLRLVLHHETNKKLYSIQKGVDRFKREESKAKGKTPGPMRH